MMNTELLYSIESPDGKRLYYQGESVEAIIAAAAEIHIDFPGEEFVVMKGGEYDATVTGLVLDGMAA